MTDALTGDMRGDLEDLICEHWTCMLSNSTVPECPAASPCPACVMRSRALALLSPAAPYESTHPRESLPAHLRRIASRDYTGVNEGFWILRDAADALEGLLSPAAPVAGDAATAVNDTLVRFGLAPLANNIASAIAISAISSMRKEDYTAHLDAIIADLTPDEHSELDGYVHQGGRMEVAEQLKAKGLAYSWERYTTLGHAVCHRKQWLSARQPAASAKPVSPQPGEQE